MTALAIRDDQTQFDEFQLAVLRQSGVDEDCTSAELAAFLHTCQRRQLDPFAGQMVLIGRWDGRRKRKVYKPQTTIDGFRLIARRAADRAGVDYEYEGTVWFDVKGGKHEAWLTSNAPAAAKVVVLRNGRRHDAVARYGAYVQTSKDGDPTGQWTSMPDVMIAKCLPYKAIIDTDQGPLPIGQIVRDRLPVKVRSINLATGEEVWAPIINWWRNSATDRWVRIWAPNGTRGNRCIRITADHPIWTPTGWRKAEEISVGDLIAVTGPTLSL